MKKTDCVLYEYAWTSASNYTEQIKIWKCWDKQQNIHFFLDNGAECTDLVTYKEGEFYYEGKDGWLSKIFGNSFKGTSEDIDKLIAIVIVIAIAVGIVAIATPKLYQLIKSKK